MGSRVGKVKTWFSGGIYLAPRIPVFDPDWVILSFVINYDVDLNTLTKSLFYKENFHFDQLCSRISWVASKYAFKINKRSLSFQTYVYTIYLDFKLYFTLYKYFVKDYFYKQNFKIKLDLIFHVFRSKAVPTT